jgi:flagellar assembly protein FliH
MACKIADDPSTIQPITWTSSSIDPTPHKSAIRRAASETDSQTAIPQEWESLRQAELAHCRRTSFEEGKAKGREEAAAEIQASADRLANTLRDLALLKRRIRGEAESEVVKLSLAVARRVLHRELSVDPESMQGIVHAALQKLQNREISRIRVSPSALEITRTALEKSGARASIALTPDPSMRSSDVVFETSWGELDASVETQLLEIERGFSDRLGLS